MRKAFWLLAFMLACFGARGGITNSVVFNLLDTQNLPQGLRNLTLYALSTPFTNGGGYIVTRDPISKPTTGAGSVTFSNLYGGPYRGEFQGVKANTTNWYQFPLTNGTINASDWTTNSGVSFAFETAYSQAQSDGRFLPLPTNNLSGIDGQVASKTGDKTKWITGGNAAAAITNLPNVFLSNNTFRAGVVITNGAAGTNTIYIYGTGTTNDGEYHLRGTTNYFGPDFPFWTKSGIAEPWVVNDDTETTMYAWNIGSVSNIDAGSPDVILEYPDQPDGNIEHATIITLNNGASAPTVHAFKYALAVNGPIGGDGGGLSNVTATAVSGSVSSSQLTGTVPSGLLTEASSTNSGVINTNSYEWGRLIPGQQRDMDRLPWGVMYGADQLHDSNSIVWISQFPGRYGYNWIEHPFGGATSPYAVARAVGSVSQFGVTRHPAFNTTAYPMGLAGYQTFLIQHGVKWLIWYDGSSQQFPSDGAVPLTTAQRLDDIATLAAWAAPVGGAIWIENIGSLYEAACDVVSTVTSNRVSVVIAATQADMTNMSSHMVRAISASQAWLPHMGDDPHTWQVLLDTADFMEAIGRHYVGDGKFPLIGTDTFINEANQTTFNIMAAMWGSAVNGTFGVDQNGNQWGAPAAFTNQDLTTIRMDPAANVCARRVLVTNDLMCLLKPMGTPAGPNYFLAVINTNASTTKTADIPWAALNSGGQQAGLLLRDFTYSVFDLKANSAVGDAQSQVSVSVGTHDYALYQLISTNRILAGDGSRIINANASTLFGSGTVPAARLPDLSGTYIARNAGIGTNVTIRGDASATNALYVEKGGVTMSNALGAVSVLGGSVRVSGAIVFTNGANSVWITNYPGNNGGGLSFYSVRGGEFGRMVAGDNPNMWWGTANFVTDDIGANDIISGGSGNAITNSAQAVIAGGSVNIISNFCPYSAIGGGRNNFVMGSAPVVAAIIPGGVSNLVSASGAVAIGSYITNSTANSVAVGSGVNAAYINSDGTAKMIGSIAFVTNSSGTKPNFLLKYTLVTTNAAFTILAPSGVDSTKTLDQETHFYVTNSLGDGVFKIIVPPANVHTNGTWAMTNLTEIIFTCHGGVGFTNATAVPWF